MAAAVIAALVALGLHAQSLKRPLAERREALMRHAEYLGSDSVTLMNRVADMNAASLARFHDLLRVGAPDDLNQRYNTAFPLFGDGTRRSSDVLFDGYSRPDGTRINGVGAYIGDAEQMSRDQEFWFWAGFETVHTIGPDYVGEGSSLYYFTPDRRMVMYAPNREDRLEFYRRTAPADFNLRADEDPILFGVESNPRRELQCTRLSYFISSEGGERTAMACRTPVWRGDILLGAFGSSFEVGDVLAQATSELPREGAVWVLNGLGHVIARNSDTPRGEREFNPETLRERFPGGTTAQSVRVDDALFAFVPIPHANWTLIVKTPIDDLITAARLRSLAVFLVIFALLALAGGVISGHLPGIRPAPQPAPEVPTE